MFKLLGAQRLLLGIDISDNYTQISYCMAEERDEAETLSVMPGTEKFNIPTVLRKKRRSNQWLFGREAVMASDEEYCPLIGRLLSLAAKGDKIEIEGVEVDSENLLLLFLKSCVSMLNKMRQPDRIEAVMFTVRDAQKQQKEVLFRAAKSMKFREERIFFQSYSESFYHYMCAQPEELWMEEAVMFEYAQGKIYVRILKCNRERTPAVVYSEEKEFEFRVYEIGGGSGDLQAELIRMDEDFFQLCSSLPEMNRVSSIYLIGEEFSSEWMEKSLKYLCGKARVFQGSNLFGKGACYGLRKKLKPQKEKEEDAFIFMGADKLRSNIGMKLLERGDEQYVSLFEAGSSWYDADRTLEIYLCDGNQINLMIASVIGGGNKLAQIILEGLTGTISRLKLHLYFTDVGNLNVEIEDLGLGLMRPGSHNLWKEVIEIERK